jgi:glutathione synthase/RimK-type ligase-like ATP-grasp enzyme
MIVVWGLPGDDPTAAVQAAVEAMGAQVVLLDQRRIDEICLELTVGPGCAGRLRVGSQSIDLDTATGVYFRPHDWRQFPQYLRAAPSSVEWDTAARVDRALAAWSEITEATVVNRPSHMAGNASKPHQARVIRSAGFETPQTLITTDPDAVRDFAARHPAVVYKSTSAVRSIVARLTADRLARIDDVRWCPTQFQELVPGTDYRAHVVGGEIFSCRISSDAVDYRYAGRDGSSVTIRAEALPGQVVERCLSLARSTRLLVCGIDLRRTPDGRWYCFEVNPSPGFTYYQSATGQRIDRAIARVLTGTST